MAVVAACAVTLAVCALPATSSASVTFGANLAASSTIGMSCTTNGCTFVNTALPAGSPPVTSPVTGTIVRWRIKTWAGGSTGPIALRVIAPAGTGMFAGAGTGTAVDEPTTATTAAFDTQLPIQAGDYIGVDTQPGASLNAISTQTGASFVRFQPPLADNGSPASPLPATADRAVMIDADVAALPTSSLSLPSCSKTGRLSAVITADPDPATRPKALHFRIDGGAPQIAPVDPNSVGTTIQVPEGSHALEYWAEDTVGGQESPHRTGTTFVDTVAPAVTIASNQGKTVYAPNEPASVTVQASDTGGSGLQSDPSALVETLPTSTLGNFTVQRTATDKCGNSAIAAFTYTVTTAAVHGNAAVSHLAAKPSSFVAASRGGSIARKTGTQITYNDSQSATTTFTVQRPARGVKRGHRCVKPKRGQTGKRCTRYVSVGRFSHVDRAGAVSFHFTGRVKGRKLKPGAYRLQAAARGPSGKPGKPAFTKIRVLRG